VTIYEKYNNQSHKTWLQITVSRWRHMNNIRTTQITLGYT